jgi:hypothetical protein
MDRIFPIGFLLLTLIGCGEDDSPENPVIPPVVSIPCDQDSCWDEDINVCRDNKYIDLFTRTTGWTGGDATYSVELDNNRRVWLFGDTFINQVNADRSRPGFKLINNSLILQENDEFTTYHGGTVGIPDAFAKPPEPGHWYWPGDGTFTNGQLYLFMHGFSNDGGGAWDFYRTSIDLLQVDPETMQIMSSRRILDNPDVSWGAAVWEDPDYTYVYGVRSEGLSKTLYVSRTNSDLSDEWEYYSDGIWSTDIASASSLLEGVSEQFSIFRSGSIFYLLTQHNLFGKEIYLYTGSSPEGPFGERRTIYCTPETGGDIFTYNAFVHTGAYTDSLLVSYNVNSFNIQDLINSADNYRPFFIKVGNWKKE